MYLGKIVEFEMRDGSTVTGRVVAADYDEVHLSRSIHTKISLHDIKRVVSATPA